MKTISYSYQGDKFLLIEFGTKIDLETTNKIAKTVLYLECKSLPGIIEVIPALTSIGVHYEPEKWVSHGEKSSSAYENLVSALSTILEYREEETVVHSKPELFEVPVVYGGDYGMDLEKLAEDNQINQRELIQIHSSQTYTVFMIGFAPGFPYLGPLDQRIKCPRKAVPLAKVPKGSVAVAANMTGIYPAAYPGGWHLIGRTTFSLFSLNPEKGARLKVGDRVRFVQIGEDEYLRTSRRC